MSKKLIAVAAAVALALTGLVAAPASANVVVVYSTPDNSTGLDVQVNVGTSLNTTALGTTVAALDVPSNNSLQYSATSLRKSLLKATVTVPASGTVVSVTTTGKVRVIDEPTDLTNKYTSTSGLSSWTKTSTSTSVVFYVYTTSIDKGSVKVSVAGNTSEVFLFGTAGPGYQMTITLPTSVGTVAPADDNYFATVVDIFGNNVATQAPTPLSTSATVPGAFTWNADNKRYQGKLYSAVAGPFAVAASIASPTAVTGFTRNTSFFGTVNATDLATQVTALTAQVAALTAQLSASRLIADSVTQLKYNKLARKWNAAFPSNKVALKK